MPSINEKYFYMIQDIRAAKLAGSLALISGFKQDLTIPELDRSGLPIHEPIAQKAAIVAKVVFDEESNEYDITPFGCLANKHSGSFDSFIDIESRKLNHQGHKAFDELTAAIISSLVELQWNASEGGVNVYVPNSDCHLFLPELSPEQYFNI